MLHIRLPDILEKILSTLDDRAAKISIGTEVSTNIKILSGVPQGSVFSPTLYTIFTNDLLKRDKAAPTFHTQMTTHIVTTPSKSKRMMKIKLER